MVLGVDDEDVALKIDVEFLGPVEGGGRGGAAVAGVSLCATARAGRDRAGLRVAGAEGVPLPFEDEDRAVGCDVHGPGAGDRRGGGGAAVPFVLPLACPGEGPDRPR